MAKPKNPLFSLETHGSLAKALTFQKSGGTATVRSKPLPSDPYSLAQAYQRWTYQDYARLWTVQLQATKTAYQTRASRYAMTGFALWMRESLTALSALLGNWHLDEGAGATAFDSSRNAINGTYFGPVPIRGPIALARYFDGANDYVDCTNNPLFDLTGDLSIEAFISTPNVAHRGRIFNRGTFNATGYDFWLDNQMLRFRTTQAAANQTTDAAGAITVNDRIYHVAVTREGATAIIYVNGIDATTAPAAHIDPLSNPGPAYIGIYQNLIESEFHGTIDEVKLHSRTLTAPELIAHSRRRYPR